MNFEYSNKVKDLQDKLTNFMNEHVYKNEAVYKEEVEKGGRWCVPKIMEDMKSKAKAQGLWNLFLPESDLGAGLTNTEYAPLCEIMGRSPIGAEVFNCSAPDTGNMEVLVRYGTKEQQNQWLTPLLNGEIRSAFAMTEPDVASSDASNIQARIDRKGNEYVINAKTGEIDINNSDIIYLTDVEATVKLKNSNTINIQSDYGKYNTKNFDTIFSKNVIIEYLENKITGEYLDFSLARNTMIISKNVIFTNEENILKADVIEINIETKDTKIFMYENDQKVNIKNKNY